MAVGETKTLPRWLKSYLAPEDLPLIASEVQKAEAKTIGEIIPMVVERSSTVGHVPAALALILFSVFLILDLNMAWSSNPWSELLLPAAAIGCYILAVPLSRFWWIQRLLTPNHDERHHVEVRAEIEFHRGAFENTERHSAILIFVSMMERRVVILADRGISTKMPPDTWSSIVRDLVEMLKTKDLKGGLIQAIGSCGAVLSQHFPADGHPSNEIANDLIIKP